MFRLLGFLIGSATSIAIILLVTGVPEFHLENPETDQKRFDEAVEKLMARKIESDNRTPAQTHSELHDENVAGSAPATIPVDALRQESNSEINSPVPATTHHVADASTIDDNVSLPDSTTAGELQWYSFWNPFRSQIAANGFVSRLESVTGLDYRVVRVKSGVYEVAFAYADDDERRRKLSQITIATGLDLPDS